MAALRRLGYTVTGPNWVDDPDISTRAEILARELVPQYDAFQDSPWPVLFRFLDKEYPGSKFILTIRPADEWIRSVVRHFGSETTPMREWIYGVGSPLRSEERYLARYEQHNRDVLQYFAGRPDDLLVLKIAEGRGWADLCSFLGHETPAEPFPYRNRAEDREAARSTWVDRLRRSVIRVLVR